MSPVTGWYSRISSADLFVASATLLALQRHALPYPAGKDQQSADGG